MAEPAKRVHSAVKIKDAVKKDGTLISVMVQITDPQELAIYKKFLESEPAFQSCPHCGHSNTVGDDDLVLRIDSPLANKIGLQIATPIMHCDHCGERVELSMLDYSAFPSVVAFINQLQARYQQLKKERNGTNG